MKLSKFISILLGIPLLVACISSRPTPSLPPKPSATSQPLVPTDKLPSATAVSPPTAIPTTPTAPPPAPTASPTVPATEEPTQPPEGKHTADILMEMGGYPCADFSDFTCVKLSQPLDTFNPIPGETITVVFAVLPAESEPKGMFVTAVGGPGCSGIAVADSYTSAFDASITDHFDIVFFDQRGVSASGNLQCAQAAADFYRKDLRSSTAAERAALLEAGETFSQDCVQEMGATRWLPYLSTDQAVRDLEAFRQAMQDHGSATADKFWLYGESYGTQFAQTYAAAYPQHLAGLILDGTVDLTLSGIDYYREQAQAFSATLVETLKACNTDELCAKDLGGDAVAAYDSLEAAVSNTPVNFKFPLPSGTFIDRGFSLADLETAAAGYLYTEATRLILLRALAAAATQDNLAPLARILYDSLYIDPETLQAIPDPSYSDAVYYGVECNDYHYPGDTPQAAAENYIRAGVELSEFLPHFASIFYGDIPCAFWPAPPPDPDRPAPLFAQGIPTLVLGATADPATPYRQGVQVFSRLADGYLVTMQGGAHVIYGRGDACVDDIVTAFLAEAQLPAQRETVCEGRLYDPYKPIPLVSIEGYADLLAAMEAVDDEINYLPEFYDWDWETPTSIGCTFSGTLSFAATDLGVDFTLQNCAFSQGLVLNGTGTYDYESEAFTLEVTASGAASGSLVYTHQADGSLGLTGEYDGRPVELTKAPEE